MRRLTKERLLDKKRDIKLYKKKKKAKKYNLKDAE